MVCYVFLRLLWDLANSNSYWDSTVEYNRTHCYRFGSRCYYQFDVSFIHFKIIASYSCLYYTSRLFIEFSPDRSAVYFNKILQLSKLVACAYINNICIVMFHANLHWRRYIFSGNTCEISWFGYTMVCR